MANPVSPSADATITTGQIAKLFDLISAGLRKSGFPGEQSQRVIEQQGESLVANFVADFRRRVEAISDLIVRRVSVNRSRTRKETLVATGRTLYVDDAVVDAMPQGDTSMTEAEIIFFKIGRYVNDDDLEKEYKLRGLVPADPVSQAAVNEADPAFADEHPNGTHWKDSSGKWCFATFNRWHVERCVNVDRRDSGWDDGWWFAGVRKEPLETKL